MTKLAFGWPERKWSLGARLTAWYSLSSFLVVLVASAIVYGALAHRFGMEEADELSTEIRVLEMDMRRPDALLALRQEVVWEVPIGEPGLYVRILGPHGRLKLETPGMSRVLPAKAFEKVPILPTAGKFSQFKGPSNRSFVLMAVRARGPLPGIVEAAVDRSAAENLLAEYRNLLAWALLGSLGVCALLGYRIAQLGIRPLQDIARIATRIGSENLSERIRPAPLPAELADLAGAFNDMLDRLEAAFLRQAQFSADIAHELRTPLSNLRGEAEVALSRTRTVDRYREVLGSSLEEYERLSRIIDSLLFIARAEDPGAKIERSLLDVGDELGAIKDYFEAAAAEAGVTLVVAIPEPLSARVDRTLFQRAVGNLVSNALRHTPLGGSVVLSATINGDHGVIAVIDTGSGIPPEHLAHVFERFYRVAPSRTAALGGSGLGLSLVRSIAALHGGTVEAESTVGQGTTMTLRLPLG